MAVEKFLSTRKLVEYLDQEINDCLAAHEVFDIGTCVWLNEDTPDPQFLGYALWQTEPPLACDYGALFGDPTSHRPTEYEEVLTVSGSDFEGLMQLARISIGLALWQQKMAEDALFEDNHYFWLHYFSAMVLLNSASDRLREFFVMGYFQKKINAYESNEDGKNNNKNTRYTAPFDQAKKTDNLSISEQLNKLASLAGDIFRFRKERNELVHEVASKTGKISREVTHKQRERFDKERQSALARQDISFEETSKCFTEAQEVHKYELRAATDQLISWYKALVLASNYAFEVENNLRKRRFNQTNEPNSRYSEEQP